MSHYTPAGITPLPWAIHSWHDHRYSRQENLPARIVEARQVDATPGANFVSEEEDKKYAQQICTLAYSYSHKTDKEVWANAAYLVHAANEYPHAIDALREMVDAYKAVLRECKYPHVDDHALVVSAESVLARAKEREESDGR